MSEDWEAKIRLLKYNTVSIKEISAHPTNVMSAEYWVNIKAGKLPFIKSMDGSYQCSHTTDLNKAIYMTEEEACELNLTIAELQKAKDLVVKLMKKYKGE
jgi:hypothetical protein